MGHVYLDPLPTGVSELQLTANCMSPESSGERLATVEDLLAVQQGIERGLDAVRADLQRQIRRPVSDQTRDTAMTIALIGFAVLSLGAGGGAGVVSAILFSLAALGFWINKHQDVSA